MKNLYLIIVSNENGKKYAHALKLPTTTNLVGLQTIPNAEIIQAAPTWQAARETAQRWNAVYKANGEYLIDDPAF